MPNIGHKPNCTNRRERRRSSEESRRTRVAPRTVRNHPAGRDLDSTSDHLTKTCATWGLEDAWAIQRGEDVVGSREDNEISVHLWRKGQGTGAPK